MDPLSSPQIRAVGLDPSSFLDILLDTDAHQNDFLRFAKREAVRTFPCAPLFGPKPDKRIIGVLSLGSARRERDLCTAELANLELYGSSLAQAIEALKYASLKPILAALSCPEALAFALFTRLLMGWLERLSKELERRELECQQRKRLLNWLIRTLLRSLMGRQFASNRVLLERQFFEYHGLGRPPRSLSVALATGLSQAILGRMCSSPVLA
jgi:hypothetical protein